jgi:MoaA/NifB/PqqE/SkfB family radical SAM enzyme
LESVIAEDIFVTVHITLNPENVKTTTETLERLANLGVKSLSLTISEQSLQDVFDTLRNKAADLGLTLRFDLPVPYSAYHPVAYETQEDKLPEGAGKAWLYVEPDGDVLPAQGMADKVLGNLLTDPWSKIYPPRA